jgi:hypothetical protein
MFTTAAWPVPKAERSPGCRGGGGGAAGAPAPDPARWLPMGHLAAGLLHQACPGPGRGQGNFYVLSRQRRLAWEGWGKLRQATG